MDRRGLLFWKADTEPAWMPILINFGLTLVLIGGFGNTGLICLGTTMCLISGIAYLYLAYQNIKKMKK